MMSFEEDMERTPFTADQDQALRALALERAPGELAEVEQATTDQDVFYALPSAAMAAWHLGKIDLAISLAEKALSVAPTYADNWNYGNAINAGHTVLGLCALHNGQTDAAVARLHQAGGTPGSPQLNSFGPSMQLAKALAIQGEFDAALTYLEQCRVFWKLGEVWLDIWKKKLQAGIVPNFFVSGYC
jgi:tetratricopeptide (TPR) repeat protein